jgi:NTP pyrophosphatase (non-canonical NTP hydrolase)
MELDRYQREAWRYDKQGADHPAGLTVSLLGLGGEVGDLLTSQKKRVRDRVTPSSAPQADTEAIGDILWYLSTTAARLGVDLDHAAQTNLRKIADRWPVTDAPYPSPEQPRPEAAGIGPVPATLGPARPFDDDHAPQCRLPRRFRVVIAPDPFLGAGRVRMVWNGRKFGDPLSDNAVESDWYRYHDAFHLAYAAVLGWSPVFRALGQRKRKDVALIDEVEDGGRAIAIEEGIAAFLFEEGRRNDWFGQGQAVPGDALALCRRLTCQLEARAITPLEWERAILTGFECWRALVQTRHAVLVADLDTRSLVAEEPSESELSAHHRVCVDEAGRAAATQGSDP